MDCIAFITMNLIRNALAMTGDESFIAITKVINIRPMGDNGWASGSHCEGDKNV